MIADPMSWGWAVGLFEGEGCILIQHPNQRLHITLQVTGTDRDVIERFQSIIGVGAIYTYNQQGHGFKNVNVWKTARRADVARILTAMMPLLGARRRTKAEEALAAIAEYESRPTSRKLVSA
jgi:hypothetical protein